MRFEWDPAKAEANRKKHGVTEEDRFIALGTIKRGVLVVGYTEPEAEVLRIVSARMATKSERQRFEQSERKQNE